MTKEEKLTLIDEFEHAYATFEKVVAGLDEATRKAVPDLPEAWSIEEHCSHLLDADANMNFRVRAAVAEPGVKVPVWNEEAWKARLAYGTTDGLRCIAIAASLRSFIAASLRSLVDQDWSTFWIEHPIRGRMDLAAVLTLYRDHVGFHLKYVERNVEAFRKAR